MPALDPSAIEPISVSDLRPSMNRRELVECHADSIAKDAQNVPFPVLQCVDLRYEDWLSFDDYILNASAVEKLKRAARYSCPVRMFNYLGTDKYPYTAVLYFPVSQYAKEYSYLVYYTFIFDTTTEYFTYTQIQRMTIDIETGQVYLAESNVEIQGPQ